jgi:MoaA/NifB/PqqE/SkfB family radical SAM enzyme/protein-L-isoaspartate O-methyltransferase
MFDDHTVKSSVPGPATAAGREVLRGDEFFARLAGRAPFNRLHPRVAAFFKQYLSHEKVVAFGDRHVVNTHFPPFPSPAFETFVNGFSSLGSSEHRNLYSVTLAVTNRCEFRCWHCYNSGRSEADLPLPVLHRLASDLQSLGTVMITLTGGEPLLRPDLEDIARSFDARSCVIVGTTGWGLDADRAKRLREAGVFGVGISLDSADEQEHDRLRGRAGGFAAALTALQAARDAGLYSYIVTVATHAFLAPGHVDRFLRLAGQGGALEVHVLEPSPTGQLAGRRDVLLSAAERKDLLAHQARVAADHSLPILSTYAYLESGDAFGCGAGLTHLYVDGSGEVSPCQFVPLSFGNVAGEPVGRILARMGEHFRRPRVGCIGRVVAPHLGDQRLPTPPASSAAICERCLPAVHALPRFFGIQEAATGETGVEELRTAYNQVKDDYDAFWLTEASRPVRELVDRLNWSGRERVFEAGCGTGYATALLASRGGPVLAADISAGMLERARHRLRAAGFANVTFCEGDALELLRSHGPFDLVFSSWVLGYIPLAPFFKAVAGALESRGRLAFVVHREDSPREPLEIFGRLVGEDPTVLTRRVVFDFPPDASSLRASLGEAGLAARELWEGSAVFRYGSPREVLEHLLKSGAGTAFHDALIPERRAELTDAFLRELAARHPGATEFTVDHEFLACIATLA